MAFDYQATAKSAAELIGEFGKSMPLARFIRTQNPVLGTVSVASVQKTNVLAVVLPISNTQVVEKMPERVKEAYVQGKARKVIVALSGVPFEPTTQDVLVFENKYWKVEGGSILKPADKAIIFTAIVAQTNLDQSDIDLLDVAPLYVPVLTFGGEQLVLFT